ncbi:MAG: hypothetical protein E7070_07230 [Bacteroidales bacterium]|jgi:hypothetical protein|nr:hypothetical protein [Bacteroidales bacterium]
MKPINKNISTLLALFGAVVMFMSCSGTEDRAFTRLSILYDDAKANAKNYTVEQWRVYLNEYNIVDSLLAECEFSEERKADVSRMKGRCAAYAREGLLLIDSRQIGNSLNQTRGAFKGFSEMDNGRIEH